jgi:hypothetical protein
MQDIKSLGGDHTEHTLYQTIVVITGYGHCLVGEKGGTTITIAIPKNIRTPLNGGRLTSLD